MRILLHRCNLVWILVLWARIVFSFWNWFRRRLRQFSHLFVAATHLWSFGRSGPTASGSFFFHLPSKCEQIWMPMDSSRISVDLLWFGCPVLGADWPLLSFPLVDFQVIFLRLCSLYLPIYASIGHHNGGMSARLSVVEGLNWSMDRLGAGRSREDYLITWLILPARIAASAGCTSRIFGPAFPVVCS